jgi:hypothetical protein
MMILNKQKVKPKSNFDTSIVSVWLKEIWYYVLYKWTQINYSVASGEMIQLGGPHRFGTIIEKSG